MTNSFSLFFIIIVFSQSIIAQMIDKQKSIIEFEIENMYISSVKGSFSGFSGDVKFDTNNLKESKVNVCIDASSVDTDNLKRDEHLRKEDFFDVTRYRDICFNSTRIYKTSKGFSAEGKLKMHGISRIVKIPLTYKDKILKGNLIVSRLDYEVGKGTGTFLVGEEVTISIKCVFKP